VTNKKSIQYDHQKHHRRSIRLHGYDYSQAGAYFITLVTYQQECIFGDIVDENMVLNHIGKIVQWEWLNLPKRFNYLELGGFMVMPNHFHGILFIHETSVVPHQGAINTPSINPQSPNKVEMDVEESSFQPNESKPASLGAIISQFKSRATKEIWKIPSWNGIPIWQRNYYERIIRDEQEMEKAWRYIESNPAQWRRDDENPHNIAPTEYGIIRVY